MIIYGKSIQIRGIEESDAEMLRDMMNSPEIEKNIGGWSFPLSKLDQRKWLDNLESSSSEMKGIISDIETGIGIGFIGLTNIDWKNRNVEIHIKTDSKKNQKKGMATEAISILCNYLFEELGMEVVYAEVLDYNIASEKMLVRCGFVVEGILRSRVYKNGQFNDLKVMSLVKGQLNE